MSSTKPLRVAILGAGLFPTEAHLPALVKLKSSATLIAIYSHTLKSASALAERAQQDLSLSSPPSVYHDQGGSAANLDALLARSDIDAVIIALPITVQPDVILAAFRHGKHVLSEKPIAPSVAQGLKLIEQYEKEWKGKLVWRVAENFEAEPAYRKIGELIKEGRIGKVVWWRLAAVQNLSKDSKWYKTPWRTVPEYQGGFLLDGGVHSAAILRTALPSHPSSLSAHVSLAQKHLEPTDTFTALALSSDGSHGLFELSMGAPVPSRSDNAFKVTGTNGWIDVTQSSGTYRIVLHTATKKKGAAEDEEVFEIKGDGVRREMECFVDAVRGGDGEGIGEPRGALRDVAFVEAGLVSKGQTVDLEKLVEGK